MTANELPLANGRQDFLVWFPRLVFERTSEDIELHDRGLRADHTG